MLLAPDPGLPGEGIMKTSKRCLLIALVIFLTTRLAQGYPAAVNSGETLVRKCTGVTLRRGIHVTVTQKSTTYNPDGTTKVETWY